MKAPNRGLKRLRPSDSCPFTDSRVSPLVSVMWWHLALGDTPSNLTGDPNPTSGLLCWVHTSLPGSYLSSLLAPMAPGRAGGPDAHWRDAGHRRSPVLWVWVLRTTWPPFSSATAPFPLRVTPSPALLGAEDNASCPSQASTMTLLPQTCLQARGDNDEGPLEDSEGNSLSSEN